MNHQYKFKEISLSKLGFKHFIHVIVSYTMGTSGLPDIYIPSLRDEGVYIRQATSAHGISSTNIYQLMSNHVWAKLNYSSMASLYLYMDLLDCIVGLNLMIKTYDVI